MPAGFVIASHEDSKGHRLGVAPDIESCALNQYTGLIRRVVQKTFDQDAGVGQRRLIQGTFRTFAQPSLGNRRVSSSLW